MYIASATLYTRYFLNLFLLIQIFSLLYDYDQCVAKVALLSLVSRIELFVPVICSKSTKYEEQTSRPIKRTYNTTNLANVANCVSSFELRRSKRPSVATLAAFLRKFPSFFTRARSRIISYTSQCVFTGVQTSYI